MVKRYGERLAVDRVGFEIAAGETYGLLGPNGAGKTTTISMVCGILARDAGEVVVAGEPMHPGAARAKAAIGLVPQDIALFPDLSAAENLRFFGRLQGLAGKHLEARVATVLDVVGLADRARERVDAYSGGMRRRANIGVGLLHEPRLLVLDEPTVGVDPQSRNAILESIEALGREGLAVLYTTHYMEEAERLCDRVGIIDEGCIVAEGTRRELVAQIGEHDRVQVAGVGDLAAFAQRAREVDGVVAATVADGRVDVLARSAEAALAPLVAGAAAAGVVIAGIEVTEPDLEAVFLHLTGKALRD
ncbi:MAG: ABC transporter ATP-binding protein [Acidimicrobiales bacterium]|nr:ABC transporter ATP-binding protein [Acidimicrobiales bacterium]